MLDQLLCFGQLLRLLLRLRHGDFLRHLLRFSNQDMLDQLLDFRLKDLFRVCHGDYLCLDGFLRFGQWDLFSEPEFLDLGDEDFLCLSGRDKDFDSDSFGNDLLSSSTDHSRARGSDETSHSPLMDPP